MAKKIDLTGQRFGRLLVLEESLERKSNRTTWKCLCDCGTEKNITTSDLRSGKVISCGCLKKERIKNNLTGKRFGRLLVLEETSERKNKQIVWKCQCDCGNIVNVRSGSLKSGRTTSCGCYQKEMVSKRSIVDIKGQQFGLLTPIFLTDKRINNSAVWLCKCECGNEIEVSQDYLRRGFRLSCGCLKESYGIRKIKQLLTDNNYSFECEKIFDTCIFPKTQGQLRFDLYVENKYLIEFDGEQHYHYDGKDNTLSWNNKEHFQNLQERDRFKNNWAKENGIILIRIPYYSINNIQIEDLLIETSKYIVK